MVLGGRRGQAHELKTSSRGPSRGRVCSVEDIKRGTLRKDRMKTKVFKLYCRASGVGGPEQAAVGPYDGKHHIIYKEN